MIERNFLAPEIEETAQLRRDLVATVEGVSRLVRQQSFLNGRRKETALEVLTELIEFLEFRGSLNIIEKLSALDDELGGETAAGDRDELDGEDGDDLDDGSSIGALPMDEIGEIRSGRDTPRFDVKQRDLFEDRADSMAYRGSEASDAAERRREPRTDKAVVVPDAHRPTGPRGGSMTTEDPAAELARLRAENEALKKATKPVGISFKVSEKGALSVYGMGRFPVTLYVEQWETLLSRADDLRAFINAHRNDLKRKE